MLVTATLPPTSGLRVEGVAAAGDAVLVVVAATRPTAACPVCGQPARRAHSRYRRRDADLPWQGLAVRLELHVRRFFCDAPDCPRRVFAERLPGLVAPAARRSQRLGALYLSVGVALGGEASARLTADLGV